MGDSNTQPSVCKTVALPTELISLKSGDPAPFGGGGPLFFFDSLRLRSVIIWLLMNKAKFYLKAKKENQEHDLKYELN